jgi:hypothetical protein
MMIDRNQPIQGLVEGMDALSLSPPPAQTFFTTQEVQEIVHENLPDSASLPTGITKLIAEYVTKPQPINWNNVRQYAQERRDEKQKEYDQFLIAFNLSQIAIDVAKQTDIHSTALYLLPMKVEYIRNMIERERLSTEVSSLQEGLCKIEEAASAASMRELKRTIDRIMSVNL